MTKDRDFGMTLSRTSTDEEKEIILDAIEDVFKFWVESKDGVVPWRTIDIAARKHKVSPNLLGFIWQGVGFGKKVSPSLDERTRAIMFYFSRR